MRQIMTGFILLLLATTATARLQIDITGGTTGGAPIAIVPFGTSGGVPEDVAAIIRADLARTGQFAPLAPNQLPAQPSRGTDIQFPQWRGLGTDHMVVGEVVPAPNGGFTVRFQLFDVLRSTQMTGYAYNISSARDLRTAAHQASDAIYEKLTGIKGVFSTRIVYVTSSGDTPQGRNYQLMLADSDGYNEQTVLNSKKPLMSPVWSYDGKQIAYVSFEGNNSEIFIQNLALGNREKIASFNGINSAPAFSPDGKKLALTLSKDGNPEIYLLDLANRSNLQRITNSFAIDTEPTFAPDGRSLVFTSDRSGKPQIYRQQLGSDYRALGQPERVTFEGDYNSRARFSPDGKKLTLVHRYRGQFRIALLTLADNSLRVLTESSLDESPSFAANGTMIIFATEEGGAWDSSGDSD